MCIKHWTRWSRHGDPLRTLNASPGDGLAYFERVLWTPAAHEGWPFGHSSAGYGRVTIDGRSAEVHVLACERAHGPRPEGHQACHECRNRDCFWPSHLSWGTPYQNVVIDARRDGTDTSGERNGCSKLTWDMVDEMRALYDAGGITHQALAGRFGTTKSNVGRVVRRQTWAR